MIVATEKQKSLWLQAEQAALEAVKLAGVEVIVPDKQPFMSQVVDLHAPHADTQIGHYLTAIKQLRHQQLED